MAHRGLRVALFSVVVAAVLSWLHQRSFVNHLVYSEAIALNSWAFVEVGRRVMRKPGEIWPLGWRGLAMSVLGSGLGFVIGTLIGDAYCGTPTFAVWTSPRQLGESVVITAVVATILCLYFYMRGSTEYHRARLATVERDASLAKLTALQSQLEPHMLFNTLANLRVLIALDPPRAQAMLDQLIAYLRATLSASRVPAHSLAAEFERLNDYLDLMQVRMGPRLQASLDLPAELATVPVPPLLLQPLVENSIRHGLEPQVDGGRIEVRAARDGDTLVLSVHDSGAGLHEHPPVDGGGFGLQQVRDRLQTMYGNAAQFTLQAAADGIGTLACIRMPLSRPSAHPEPPCTPPH
jgi:signal transduction histidine kinase